MPDYPFKSTRDFDAVCYHLRRYCRIHPAVAGERLHEIKAFHGLRGDDNVVFDFSGGVHLEIASGVLQFLGTLTTGGAKEVA